MKGTIIDCVFIILGGLIGTLLKTKLNIEKMDDKVMQYLGMCAILVGMAGSVSVNNPIVAIVAIVAGGVIGNFLRLEEHLGMLLNKGGKILLKMPVSSKFVEGVVSFSLISIVGSMSIVGAMQNALTGDITLLITKTALDFVCAILFGITYGSSVCFASFIVFLYQGMFASLALFLEPVLDAGVVGDMSAIGSVLIFVVGLNLLKVTDLKTMDLVPAIFLPIILGQFL